MRQHQAPSLGRQRHLRRLLRRRMPRLLRPLLLLLPKRRLVDQEIGPRRRIHDRRAGPRVAGKHDEPPRSLGANKAVSRQLSAVSKLDRFPF